MALKAIVSESQAASQGHTDAGSPTDGLRLLARMIACDLMAKESACKNSEQSSQATGQQGLSGGLQFDINTEVSKGRQDA